ncbi:MAG: hypothetical protein DRJ51_00205 [Thermoprotei archaeon]|nr:MAG: hypothetical protein DRJ36_02315 [Thermoprotei archaeon]RLE82909.1 MAG: hypothetical protein DRJ51_00205 [Thermoprotei archaeon]RLF03070.1 MAG: hypothetical protein DRJ59_01760 [Thermoprotei archaeon]
MEVRILNFMPKILRGVVSYVFKKPVTKQYPLERVEPAPVFRGKMSFNPDLCVGCGMCARDCPTGAITMEFYPHVKRKMPKFYYGLCIFCHQCVESCAWNAIKPTTQFELATYDKKQLIERVSEQEVKPVKPRRPEKKLFYR